MLFKTAQTTIEKSGKKVIILRRTLCCDNELAVNSSNVVRATDFKAVEGFALKLQG